MRLKISRNAAEERLRFCLKEGYDLRRHLWEDYNQLQQSKSFDKNADNKRYAAVYAGWGNNVVGELEAILPMSLESAYFCDQPVWHMASYSGVDQDFGRLYYDTLPNLIGP